ncbi:MAG: hypothetical protein KBD64_07795 [Gammaproteobacteria bacterium]|nr:hypothetical protein [Gammaproteobacteria bacterium]
MNNKINLILGASLVIVTGLTFAQTTTPAAPAPVCGNGILEGSEACDLGTKNGPNTGCDATSCTIQTGWKCAAADTPNYATNVTNTVATASNPNAAFLTPVSTQLSLADLWAVLGNTIQLQLAPGASTPSIPTGVTHISSIVAKQVNCNTTPVTGFGPLCAQYAKDITRFKELNKTVSIETMFSLSPTLQTTYSTLYGTNGSAIPANTFGLLDYDLVASAFSSTDYQCNCKNTP